MKIETARMIKAILEYFNEEELRALAITSRKGLIVSTFEEQLIARYNDYEPRYEFSICKAKAYGILDDNVNLIERLLVSKSSEFRNKMKEELTSPEGFISKNITNIKIEGGGKILNLGDTSTTNLTRASTKDRSGSADSGQEYLEIDKYWDAEDMTFLNSNSPIEKKFPHIKIKQIQNAEATDNAKRKKRDMREQRSIDKYEISFDALPPQQNPVQKKFDPTTEETLNTLDQQLAEKPAFYTITTQQSRNKVISDADAKSLEFSENKRDAKTDVTKTYTARIHAYQKFNSLQIRPIREVLLKKLDVLFKYCGCLY